MQYHIRPCFSDARETCWKHFHPLLLPGLLRWSFSASSSADLSCDLLGKGEFRATRLCSFELGGLKVLWRPEPVFGGASVCPGLGSVIPQCGQGPQEVGALAAAGVAGQAHLYPPSGLPDFQDSRICTVLVKHRVKAALQESIRNGTLHANAIRDTLMRT